MHGDWGNVCRYLFVLLWLVLTLSAGVHLFSKGFLLSRVTNTYYTNCTALERCTDGDNVNLDLNFVLSTRIFFQFILLPGEMSVQIETGWNVQRFKQID